MPLITCQKAVDEIVAVDAHDVVLGFAEGDKLDPHQRVGMGTAV